MIAGIYGYDVVNNVASFEEIAPSQDEMAARMGKIAGAGLPYLVAERDHSVLGFAYASPYHPRSAYRYTLEDTVYIHRNARRQGVGRALLAALIQRCEAVGCRQMIAAISDPGNSASVALHTAMGFRMMGIGQAIGFKFERWIDVAYMQLKIGAGNTIGPDWSAAGRKL